MARASGGPEAETERDRKGRFSKGKSGNPKGRPRKPIVYAASETSVLARTLVGKAEGGRPITVEEMNNLKLVEAARRGDVRAQIHLDRKFEKWRAKETGLRRELLEMEMQYVISGEYEEIPRHIRYWMVQAYAVLNETPIWERWLTPEVRHEVEKGRQEIEKLEREWQRKHPGQKLPEE